MRDRPGAWLQDAVFKNGLEIWKVGKGRQFPSPDEGAKKEKPSWTFLTEVDFFFGGRGNPELPTPAYPTQDKPKRR
jgi:hypothetical protein